MKWTKFTADFDSEGYLSLYSHPEKKYIKNTCFVSIEGDRLEFEKNRLYRGDAAEEIRKEQYHKWICQKVPKEYLDSKYFEPKYFKDKGGKIPANYKDIKPHPYEIFIGGWLHFYDLEVQNGYSDHAVYFDWDIEGYSVTVYLFQLKPQDKRLNINVNVN